MSSASSTGSAPPRDGSHDFDFLHGTWRVHNRRLRDVLSGSNDWYDFDGSATERSLWEGRANLEEWDAVSPSGRIRGLALRLYEPQTQQWTISWASGSTGRLDSPMRGEFRDGRGVFVGQAEIDGKVIHVRFIWTVSSPNACRWEQAFSADAGATWETNWIMDFTHE